MERVPWRLCLLFTPELCAADPWDTLRAAIAGGVDVVQWRVKHDDQGGATRCRDVCAETDTALIVNDDVHLAIDLDAAGAHVGQGDMPAATARALLGPDRILGVSTHSDAEIDAALRDGADYIGFGPMFATATKGFTEGQPNGALRAAIERSTVPVFAIGGITPGNVDVVRKHGARHLAISAAILRADDPAAAATQLVD